MIKSDEGRNTSGLGGDMIKAAMYVRYSSNKHLSKDADIKQKSLDDQKKIIQTYIAEIIVNGEDLKINYVVDMGGVESGIRTTWHH